MGTEKSTRSIRVSVMVVVPHSTSTWPEATASILLAASTGRHSTFRAGTASDLPMAAATRSHSSTEYPCGVPLRDLNENGAAPSR